ncbi:MAG: hydrogenase maturation protease [Candidatus Kentron sp. G]|nr:MAG: hydrogenase maturation protease [Candidatus Kentron sp. G]VFN00375.1 MAG: hydrogenase maturation protease [Candidatus Kentron sp. G]
MFSVSSVDTLSILLLRVSSCFFVDHFFPSLYKELAMLSTISIAGAGNWLISHDRIGPRVLRLIRGRYGPAVELCDIGTSGLRLLDYLRGQALLVIIDACLMNEAPGTIRVLEPDLRTPEDAFDGAAGRSTHQIGPLETLALAQRLYRENMPRRVLLIMVETRGIDAATERAACREVVGALDRALCKSSYYARQQGENGKKSEVAF